MSTPAQIGKNEYKAAIVRSREKSAEIRNSLQRIMQESNSNLIQALAGKIALSLGELDAAVTRLDEIGKTLKK